MVGIAVIKRDFGLFGGDQIGGCLVPGVARREGRETGLQGAIVILAPAMLRQGEVTQRGKAVRLQHRDLGRGRVHLGIGLHPVIVQLVR